MTPQIERIISGPSKVRDRWLPLDLAAREVVAYEQRHGHEHLWLACHAALPAVVTPELVNLLRINFLEGKDVPWIAEADFLLSSLCRQREMDIFEVEPQVREVLLYELEDRFGPGRPLEVASFLLTYAEERPGQIRPPDVVQLYQLIGSAYLDPDTAVQHLRTTFDASLSSGSRKSQRIKVARIVEIVAAPLELSNSTAQLDVLKSDSRLMAQALYGERGSITRTMLAEARAAPEGTASSVISPELLEWLETEVLQEAEVASEAEVQYGGEAISYTEESQTQAPPGDEITVPEPPDSRYLTSRTPDGTYNNLSNPMMGSTGYSFGRAFPLEYSFPDTANLYNPSPREVSRRLLARERFIPATTINLLAAPWLQFMVNDWFSHGKNDKDNVIQIPLDTDDPWSHGNPMTFLGTTRGPAFELVDLYMRDVSPVHYNSETHWWDGSQIYGSTAEKLGELRSGEGGKLKTDGKRLLQTGRNWMDLTGVTGNYWVGLSILHTLFTLEHNAICDHLRSAYPGWSDDDLFDHARLINAALMAKIHTYEWVPAILPGQRSTRNLFSNMIRRAGELLRRAGGVRTGRRDDFFPITEEFVAVCRMHAMIPDEFSFRSLNGDYLLQERPFPEVAGLETRRRMEEMSPADIIYSFGTSHPGAVTLHNYPNFLTEFYRPDGRVVDVASIDIFRDRERGIPRYNQFRELLGLSRVDSFEGFTDNPEWAREIGEVYNWDPDMVDLMVGLYAEPLPRGYGFSPKAWRIIERTTYQMLSNDRFYTADFRPEVYSPEGMTWIENNSLSTVLLRHYPELEQFLRPVLANAFAPWPRARAQS